MHSSNSHAFWLRSNNSNNHKSGLAPSQTCQSSQQLHKANSRIPSFYGWENGRTDRLSSLSKDTKLVWKRQDSNPGSLAAGLLYTSRLPHKLSWSGMGFRRGDFRIISSSLQHPLIVLAAGGDDTFTSAIASLYRLCGLKYNWLLYTLSLLTC